MKLISIHSSAKRLMMIRGLRSIGQGAMVVDLGLYLRELHWSAISIGSVLSAGGLLGAILILVIGVLSDRFGRKNFLIIYEVLTILSAVTAFFSTNAVLLFIAIILAGFGRGAGGSAGPFMPAEQAWLAQFVDQSDRGRVYSLNNAVGFLGMAVGALLGGLPELLQSNFPGYLAYRPIFFMIVILSIACIVLIIRLPESSSRKSINLEVEQQGKVERDDMQQNIHLVTRKKENREMLKLSVLSMINGIAIGLTGPLMSYWFATKYHVSAGSIGITIALSFLLTSISSVINGFLSSKVGMVTSVTRIRFVAAVLMLLLPFSPTFWIASVIYVLRIALNRGTQGARAALSASVTGDERRGLAISLNSFSMRITASIGPTLSGLLFDTGRFALPFYFTAGIQVVYAWMYQKLFHDYDAPSVASNNKMKKMLE